MRSILSLQHMCIMYVVYVFEFIYYWTIAIDYGIFGLEELMVDYKIESCDNIFGFSVS